MKRGQGNEWRVPLLILVVVSIVGLSVVPSFDERNVVGEGELKSLSFLDLIINFFSGPDYIDDASLDYDEIDFEAEVVFLDEDEIDPENEEPVTCKTNDDCKNTKNPKRPYCVGICMQCLEDKHCTDPKRPYCEVGVCRGSYIGEAEDGGDDPENPGCSYKYSAEDITCSNDPIDFDRDKCVKKAGDEIADILFEVVDSPECTKKRQFESKQYACSIYCSQQGKSSGGCKEIELCEFDGRMLKSGYCDCF